MLIPRWLSYRRITEYLYLERSTMFKSFTDQISTLASSLWNTNSRAPVTTRGVDWGSYLGPCGEISMPWELLIQNAGVQFAIFKGDQEDATVNISTQKNMAAARANGIVVGCYYWDFPGWSAQYKIDHYSTAIDRERPDFIAYDIEDHLVNGGVKSPDGISEGAKFTCNGLKERFPQLKIVPYTAKWFVQSWAPPMAGWLPQYKGNEWVASYYDYGEESYRLEWDQIRQTPEAGYLPALPPGWNSWKFWQYSSRIRLPLMEAGGIIYDHQIDWNLFNGTLDELKAWCGIGPQIPTVEERLYRIENRMDKLERWARTQEYQG